MKFSLSLGFALVLSVILTGGCTVPMPLAAMPQKILAADAHISTLHMLDARHGWALTGGLAGQQRLLLTRNGGQSWREGTPAGAPGIGDVDAVSAGVYFLDARHGWVSVWGQGKPGLWRTGNGGKSWSYSKTTDLYRDFHFRDASHGIACSSNYGLGNAYYRFYETQDGGASWQPVLITPPGAGESGLPAGTLHLCNLCTDLVDYRPPGRVMITRGDFGDEQPKDAVRLTLSTNLGKSWCEVRLPLPSEKYRDWLVTSVQPVFFDDRSGDLAAHLVRESADGNTLVSNAMAFYTTQDGGETWTSGPGVINAAIHGPVDDQWDIVSTRDIFCTSGANLRVTHDGAKSWQTVQPRMKSGANGPVARVLQVDFIDAKLGWGLLAVNPGHPSDGSGCLAKTTDGGATWTELPLEIE